MQVAIELVKCREEAGRLVERGVIPEASREAVVTALLQARAQALHEARVDLDLDLDDDEEDDGACFSLRCWSEEFDREVRARRERESVPPVRAERAAA